MSTLDDTASPDHNVYAAELLRWSTVALGAAGAPSSTAARVATSLVESDLRGYVSHGVMRLPGYVADVRSGAIDPGAEPSVVPGGRGATLVVDGNDAFGQLTAEFAVDELARRAADTGVAFAVTRRCRHVGRLGDYVERLASHGFIGFAVVNAEPLVAASPGRTRVLGTNPHAWGFPGGDSESAVVVDFATSIVSAGRVMAARANGEQLGDGLIIDREGAPSHEPDDLFSGGALLPFGGHKGFALGLVADLLAGVLSGSGSGSSPTYVGYHGLALLAIDVSAFLDLDEFTSEVEALRSRVAASSTRDDATGSPLPGEGSATRRRSASASGVLIPTSTAAALSALALSLGVPELATTPTPTPTHGA